MADRGPLRDCSCFQRCRVSLATIAVLLLQLRTAEAQIASQENLGPLCPCGRAGGSCGGSLAINSVAQPQLDLSSGFTTFALRNAGLAVAAGDAGAGFANANAADALLAIEFPQNVTVEGLIVTACIAAPWWLPSGEVIANTSLALVANCFAGLSSEVEGSGSGSLSLAALGIVALGGEPDRDGCTSVELELLSTRLRKVFVHAEPALPPWVQPQVHPTASPSSAAASNSSCELTVSWQFVTASGPQAQSDSQAQASAAAGAGSNLTATPSASPSAWQSVVPSCSAAPSLAVRSQPSGAAATATDSASASVFATASVTPPPQQPADEVPAGAVCAAAQWEAAEPCDASCGGGLQLCNRQVWIIDAAAGLGGASAAASPLPSQAAIVSCGPAPPPAFTLLPCNTLACPSPDGQSRPFIAFASLMQASGAGTGAAAAGNYSSATAEGRVRRAAFRAALAAALTAAAAVPVQASPSPQAQAGVGVAPSRARARRAQAAATATATASTSATASIAVAATRLNVSFAAADVSLGEPAVSDADRQWPGRAVIMMIMLAPSGSRRLQLRPRPYGSLQRLAHTQPTRILPLSFFPLPLLRFCRM